MTMRRAVLTLWLLALTPALALAQAQPRPVIHSTVQTTNTTANSLLVGCAIGSTSCSGGIKAGPITASTFTGTGAISGSQITVTGSAFIGGDASITGELTVNDSTTLLGTVFAASLSAGATVQLVAGSTQPVQIKRTLDGTLIDFQVSAVSQGSVSTSGGTVAYNTFLGTHYTQPAPGQIPPLPGTVVASMGVQIPSQNQQPGSERFVYVEPTTRRNQRSVYGVWFGSLRRTAAGMSWGDPAVEVFQVAALGLTEAWVTDTCGDLETGYLLASSPREGLAEAQCQGDYPATIGGQIIRYRYDDRQHDYTLGKALVPVRWAEVAAGPDGIKRKLIPVTLYP